MRLIKIQNNFIRLEHPLKNKNSSIGLHALYFKNFKKNFIEIKTDGKIVIGDKTIVISHGKYTIEQINQTIYPVLLTINKNNTVSLTSDRYFHLDENLCEHLGINFKKLDYTNISKNFNKIIIPYINIETNCTINVSYGDTLFVKHELQKNHYTIKELENVINNFSEFKSEKNTITQINLENNTLKIRSLAKFQFSKELSKYLGIEWNNSTPFQSSFEGNKPNIILKTFYNVEGTIYTENQKICIPKNNYTFENLKEIFPKTIQLKIEDNNTLLITSEKYFHLDKILSDSLGIEYIQKYKIQGNPIEPKKIPLEIHCDIIEKSFSSVNNTHHVEEGLLFVFLLDQNNLFIKTNQINYIPINTKEIQEIKIEVFDQEGNIFDCNNNLIIYLSLINR